MFRKYINIALTVSLLFAASLPSKASLVAISAQTVEVNGKYLPENPPDVPDPRRDFSKSYNGNNLGGISRFDFDLATQGVDSGLAYWEVGIQQSSLRSLSDLRIQHDFSNELQFTDMTVDVNSNIAYEDTITVTNLTTNQPATPSNLQVRFEVEISGAMYNDVTYDNPQSGGASVANYSSEANFSSRIANTRGNANTDFQFGKTNSEHSNGIFGENVLERDFVNSTVIFNDLLWDFQGLFFGWSFSELFKVEIEGIDAGSIDINLQNDMGSTFVTRASVFDENGNWLSNFAVQSSEGFLYDQISNANVTPTPVSAPITSLLFMAMLIGLICLRKRVKN